MLKIILLDLQFEEIETSLIDAPLIEVVELIDKVNEFKAGTDRLRYEKTGWIAVDFENNEIEIQLNFEV